jgi:hypothetical protein
VHAQVKINYASTHYDKVAIFNIITYVQPSYFGDKLRAKSFAVAESGLNGKIMGLKFFIYK